MWKSWTTAGSPGIIPRSENFQQKLMLKLWWGAEATVMILLLLRSLNKKTVNRTKSCKFCFWWTRSSCTGRRQGWWSNFDEGSFFIPFKVTDSLIGRQHFYSCKLQHSYCTSLKGPWHFQTGARVLGGWFCRANCHWASPAGWGWRP
jgi:hypothetical protein